MDKIINSHRTTLLRAMFLLTLILTGSIFAQNVRINRVWGAVSAAGNNKGITYGGSNLNLFADYGAFGCRFQGTEGFFGGFVGVAMDNWNGNKSATFVPIDKFQPSGVIKTPLVNYTRYANPVYTVTSSGTTSTPPANDLSPLTATDPAKCIGTSDQTITVTNTYYKGNVDIDVTRKILGWSQNYHNNYVIVDLTFTNNSKNTYTNFYIFLHDGEYQLQRADGTNPGVAAIDQYANSNTPRRWYHYYGAKTADSLRIFYNYSSDDPEIAGDRIGQPLTQYGGRLLDYEYTIMATLHASKQPYTPTAGFAGPGKDPNDVDDMNQPSVTTYANMQNNLNLGLFTVTYDPTGNDGANYYKLINGTTLASQDMTGADVRPGHHRKNQDELGKNAPGAETAISDLSNSFESMIKCYGPYTFAPGQQLRIVKMTGVAGISRDKAVEVGKAWYADTKNGTSTLTDPTGLPNTTTGYYPTNFVFPTGATPTDLKKDRWVSTGIDSVHKTVSRAKWNFNHNYNVPVTPPPPATFAATGSSNGITLNWTDPAAEAMSNFAGYRIMKKVGGADTTYYQEVYRSTSSDKGATHQFTDTKVRVSASYYYYVQAIANISSTDPNAHPTERGKTIYSSRVYFYVNTPVNGEAPVGNALDKIAIVPNPFNYKDPLVAGYGWTNPTNLQISFFELPKTVTIRIFTEFGDLVRTIEHNQDSGFDKWNMTNESGQIIAAGIYIVVFQTPDGAVSYQKLVVAR